MDEEKIEIKEATPEVTLDVSQKSILDDIKKLLGLSKDDTSFDDDITIHINTVFMALNQLGVGPEKGFRISDSSKKWVDYISDEMDLEAVKTYIYLKVKLVFDPPLSSTVIEAYKQAASEIEWRLNINAESKGGNV